MNLQEAGQHAMNGGFFSRQETFNLLSSSLREGANGTALELFLTGLANRGETAEEIQGGAEALRAACVPFLHDAADALDTCGTGGDGLGSFNLSTAAALVAAGAGAKVIKHGNRSVSSQCGSADLLEAAGVHLELNPEQARRVFETVGMVFLYAPTFHPAMRFVAPVRKKMGRRTLFNYLGPLCSPGNVQRQLLGVGVAKMLPAYAEVLRGLGVQRAYVVHGAGGADELTPAGHNQVFVVGDAPKVSLDAKALGLPTASVMELEGGDASVNLKLLHDLLHGEKNAIRTAVLQNTAAALLLNGAAKHAKEGVAMAEESLDSGAARIILQRLIQKSQEESQR